MEVLFCNLPKRMSTAEIRRLVSSAILPKNLLDTVKSVLFMGQSIKRLEFKIVTEHKSGEVCRYGIAIIEPDKSAERIIERLCDDKIRGHRITVREFKNRSYSNDRRAVNWRDADWSFTERRKVDRRIAAESVNTN